MKRHTNLTLMGFEIFDSGTWQLSFCRISQYFGIDASLLSIERSVYHGWTFWVFFKAPFRDGKWNLGRAK